VRPGRGSIPGALLVTGALFLISGGTIGARAAPRLSGDRENPRWWLTVEGGATWPGRLDVRIPPAGGTPFSLDEDLAASTEAACRVRLDWRLGRRDWLILLYAPLAVESSGHSNRQIRFVDTVFPASTPLTGTYRFDTYRLGWQHLWPGRRFSCGLGATALVRDAVISLRGGDLFAQKPNTGFVPLVHFLACWHLAERLGLRLEGDALAAPQGRAEDVLLAVELYLQQQTALYAGYRVLEGGADVDDVYTFALLHYVVGGLRVTY
jgi:hypothetical protein